MKINKRLRLNTFISLGIIITMMVTLAWSFREVYRANQKMFLTDKMRKLTFERIFLRDNYIINASKQTKVQWQTKSKKLRALMESASETFTETEEIALLQEARKNFEKTFSSFSEIMEQYKQNDHAGEKFLFSQTQLKQINNIFINAQSLNDSLDRLYELNERTMKKEMNRGAFVIVFFVIGGALIIAVNSSLISKMLAKRIMVLHEGIEIIGGGNLDYQTDMKGDDELSDLARGVNGMAAGLKQSYTSIDNLQREVAERKQMEEALARSQNFLNLVIENTPNATWISDKDGTVIMLNEALRNLLKIRDEEIIGIYNVQKDIQVEEQGFLPLVKSVFTEGKTVEFTIEYNTGKEKQVDLQMTTRLILDIIITPVIDNQGKVINAIAQHKDITERKRAEEEILRLKKELEQKVADRTSELHYSQLALLNLVDDLNQSAKNTDSVNRKLEEANKELAAFSYSVSHDLRAPLRSIDGFSLALLEDYQEKLDDSGRKYLNKIRAATQHMGSLIEDMLKLSRITHAELHHESIDLSKMVHSIAETMRQSNPDEDMKMTIQEGIVIKGDLHSMQIAITNLLENAWKFTGKQKDPLIEFGMNLTEGKKIYFIRDNGVGFDMAFVNKLFGAFQRLHKKDDFPGTGIGLATVKRIISRHGGQIWAEGEVGKGATFFFTLPE